MTWPQFNHPGDQRTDDLSSSTDIKQMCSKSHGQKGGGGLVEKSNPLHSDGKDIL